MRELNVIFSEVSVKLRKSNAPAHRRIGTKMEQAVEQTYFSGRCKKTWSGSKTNHQQSHYACKYARCPMNEITRSLASLPVVHYLGSNTPCASGLVCSLARSQPLQSLDCCLPVFFLSNCDNSFSCRTTQSIVLAKNHWALFWERCVAVELPEQYLTIKISIVCVYRICVNI